MDPVTKALKYALVLFVLAGVTIAILFILDLISGARLQEVLAKTAGVLGIYTLGSVAIAYIVGKRP